MGPQLGAWALISGFTTLGLISRSNEATIYKLVLQINLFNLKNNFKQYNLEQIIRDQ